MSKKVTLILVILLAPGALLARAPDHPNPAEYQTAAASGSLVGRWESVARSSGGIGETLEFLPDGQFLTTPTVLVDSRYRVDADHLIMNTSAEPKEVVMAFVIRGDRMSRQTGAKKGGVKLRRITEPAELPIVGTWTYKHYTGPDAFETFYADGRHEFRLPMRAPTRGTYRVEGDRLELQMPKSRYLSKTFRITEDELVLRNKANAGAKRYRRQVSP